MKKNKVILKVICYLFASAMALIFLFPLFWTLITSFKSYRMAFAQPPVFFPPIDFSNYVSYLSRGDFMLCLRNSLVVTLVSASVSVVLGVLAAYALVRGNLRGGNAMAMFMLASRFVPPVATVIPMYMIYRKIGLYDTLPGLILLHLAMDIPYVVWMMRGFFQEVPLAVEEASWIEGCSRVGSLARIVIPMSKAGLAATGVLTMIFSWNEFLFAMIMGGVRTKTLPISMAMYMGETGIEWHMMATAGILVLLPALIFSILVHRNLGAGLSFGAVKG